MKLVADKEGGAVGLAEIITSQSIVSVLCRVTIKWTFENLGASAVHAPSLIFSCLCTTSCSHSPRLHAFRESFEEEDTCHMRRRIHAQGDSCMPFDELAAQVFELPR